MSFPRKPRLRGLSVSIAQLTLYRVLQGVGASMIQAQGRKHRTAVGTAHGTVVLDDLACALGIEPELGGQVATRDAKPLRAFRFSS